MDKLKIVLSGIYYPLAMLSYFRRALERRKDVELFTVGPFTNNWIPWAGGMYLPMRYVKAPSMALDKDIISFPTIFQLIESKLPWKPDLWLQVDAGWYLRGHPKEGKVAHVATDPHVLNYDRQRQQSDVFFNMQMVYAQAGDEYLPYAFDPFCHFRIDPPEEKNYDAILVGLQYEQRTKLVNELKRRGHHVFYGIGPIYDEFRQLYNQSRIALNWSSLLDLNARTFEAMGMGVPLVTNRVPDLCRHFVEGEHYFGFENMHEAITAVEHLLTYREEAQSIADHARDAVYEAHTYDHRIEQILQRFGLL